MGLAWYPVVLALLVIVVGLLAATGYSLLSSPHDDRLASSH